MRSRKLVYDNVSGINESILEDSRESHVDSNYQEHEEEEYYAYDRLGGEEKKSGQFRFDERNSLN